MMYSFYSAEHNSDLTEGRGHMVSHGYFESEDDAIEAVQGWGVQGVGTGEVYQIRVFSSFAEWGEARDAGKKYSFPTSKKLVYGYRKDWKGKWGYGYVDNRDAPVNDPDYETYVRLKNKFGD